MVSLTESQPGPSCVVATVITYPYIIVAITRVEGTVTAMTNLVTVNCP